jgi:hypothetical protein
LYCAALKNPLLKEFMLLKSFFKPSLRRKLCLIIVVKMVILSVFVHYCIEKPKQKPTFESVGAALLGTPISSTTKGVRP